MPLKILLSLIIFVSFTLSGCAGYAPHQGNLGLGLDVIGESRDKLVSRMGPPEREYFVDGTQVLHFPRGPAGRHTYFVYLDDQQRVAKWEQVLIEQRFDRIMSGMTKEQVIKQIGISKITHGMARERGTVWHYRYFNQQCKSFVIEFTAEDIVRSAGYRTRSGRRCNYVGLG